MDVTTLQVVITLLCAVLVGFSKTGVPTLGIFVAAIMASVFPTRESVGILTPILITGDIMAILYYRKAVIWKHLFVLLPWVMAGIVIGFFVLGHIGNRPLSIMIGTLVLLLIVLHVFRDRIEQAARFSLDRSRFFNGSLGILAGFTTMIGNAAGSIMSIYLLTKQMDKTNFVGTTAFFFFIVNVVKVPFTAYLGLITPETLLFNMWMIPAVAVGAFAGFKVLPLIPQQMFQRIILILAALGGVNLIVF
ncbi:sulfite exporter TauE/SafE family protein [Paenibacillus senegalensis]|uniref:sulfite exporter TauE/SafE family protein n=1 Tax=Paenibacillus senegalensis TaxID=1465766 RepID=UPI0002890415|nr:sulfite exporter TauE/SafE family protein [Paenibacillus senegalensis]